MKDQEFKKLLRDSIRIIPGFPKPGIDFVDITPVLASGSLFRATVTKMADIGLTFDYVVAPEARGFIFGSAIAFHTHTGLIIARKPNKLPLPTVEASYTLEYGHDTLHMHRCDIRPGSIVLLVDDILATGGTAAALETTLIRLGCKVAGLSVLGSIVGLNGKDMLKCPVYSLLDF